LATSFSGSQLPAISSSGGTEPGDALLPRQSKAGSQTKAQPINIIFRSDAVFIFRQWF
jgi:hypothetical protein